MINHNENYFAGGMMCSLASASHSGYYNWRYRPLDNKDQANQKLMIEIKHVVDEEKVQLGSVGIAERLHSKLCYVSPETFKAK